ncbi:hypothetical protein HYV57_06025 [Candidatus Peregrinibacteria bacterium]|nr:hypothetical protein [Candidatus Peregrinibacteria bacterium]
MAYFRKKIIKFISILLLILVGIIFTSVFAFDYIFLNPAKSKKLQEYCVKTDINGAFINDIRKELQNYYFYGLRKEKNNNETMFFKATSKSYDFARCEVTYEKNSGKIIKMRFNYD